MADRPMKAISLWQPARRIALDLSKPCRTWTGTVEQSTGYGRIMIDGQNRRVHKLTYQLHVGPVPKGWQVDHACHNAALERGECSPGICIHRACWEPAHLEAVSSAENSRRGGHLLFVVARLKVCAAQKHDLTNDANVYTRSDGRRRCRPCQIEKQRDRRAGRARA